MKIIKNSKNQFMDTKKQELIAKAEIYADDAKFAWDYASNPKIDADYSRKCHEEADFYLRLSRAYSEILKGYNDGQL